jgi:hypothetical protein
MIYLQSRDERWIIGEMRMVFVLDFIVYTVDYLHLVLEFSREALRNHRMTTFICPGEDASCRWQDLQDRSRLPAAPGLWANEQAPSITRAAVREKMRPQRLTSV